MIPVTFTFQGKTHTGTLSKVSGAASDCRYELMVDNYYWGALMYFDSRNEWRFLPNNQTEGLQHQTDYFVSVLQEWSEGVSLVTFGTDYEREGEYR